MNQQKMRLFFGAAFFLNLLFFFSLEIYFRWKASALFSCGDLSTKVSHLNDHFVRFPHPGIGYVLCPQMTIELLGKNLSSNSLGFRDKEFKKQKEKFRMIGVGDSVLMGWGVADRENFFHLVTDQLGIEGYNFSVAGYSAFNQYYVIKDLALNYEPDLIVLSYVGNDWEDFPEQLISQAPRTPSYLLNYIIVHLKKYTQWQEWRPHPFIADQPGHLVEAYQLIADELNRRQIPLILVLDSRYQSPVAPHAMISELGKYHGFIVLDLFNLMRPEDEHLSLDEAISSELEHNKKYIIDGDGHANERWHQDVAALLRPLIEELIDSKN